MKQGTVLLGRVLLRGLAAASRPQGQQVAGPTLFNPHNMHTISLAGQQNPRPSGAWTAGAAASRWFAQRAAGGVVAVPLMRRKLHVAAHSLASEEATTVAPQPVLAAAAAAAAQQAAPGGSNASSRTADERSSSGGGSGSSGTSDSSGSSSGSAASASAAGPDAAGSSSSSSSSSSGDASPGAGGGTPAAEPPPAPVLLRSGAAMLPHPDKAHRGGEDAYFISDPPLALGVADGVGGWAEIGVDAGAYARLLMSNAKEEADAQLAAGGPLAPQAVLERAYYRTNVMGSSTACVLALNGSTLVASNVGDSGFIIVRGGAPAFQSPQQQHNFNFPYQLGSADGGASDHPSSALRFEIAVQPGDVIIAGTDGLFDNVFAEEAATIVARCKAQGDSPEKAAATLCRYARMRAMDPKHQSPFSYAAIQAGYSFIGGKLDDITVVVAYVTMASSKL